MDCEFIRLLVVQGHSRVPVSLSDRSTLRQHLHRAEKEIRTCKNKTKKLEADISASEKRRKGLEKRRQRLQKLVDLYRSVLSPIQGMPTEILSSIFAFCCEMNGTSSPRSIPVMSLSMVCGRWRDIVLSTPHLWSKLDIDHPRFLSTNKILAMARITQLFMQRSKNAPLTWSSFLDVMTILPVFQHLFPNSERWRSVTLCVDSSLLDQPAFMSISGRIPILQRLRLLSGDPQMRLDTFAVAPALSEVDCTPRFHHNIALPWAQIRNLTLRDSYAPESLSILSQCRDLEQLKLDCIGGGEWSIQVTVPITLHKVYALSDDDYAFAFEFLTLPSLSSITLSSDDSWEGISWGNRREEIQGFLSRSQCSIISLRIEVPGADDHETISFLLLLPTLETLYIDEKEQEYDEDDDDSDDSDDGSDGVVTVTPLFLQQFLVKDGHPAGSSRFLPRLSNLTLVVRPCGLDVESLCDAIISRWNAAAESGVCRLQSVTIKVMGRGVCLEKLLALEKLGTEGRRITVSILPHY